MSAQQTPVTAQLHSSSMRKSTVSFFESIMLIVGSVIGAGVLGIPYVVAQVGFGIGLVYLVVLGLVVILLHLVLGEVVVRTKKNLQVGGLAEKYLGREIGQLMKLLMVLVLTTALVAYVIGMGEAAEALFVGTILGWSATTWSILLWGVGSIVVAAGMRALAHMEFMFASIIFVIIVIIVALAMPSINPVQLSTVDYSRFFLPYGVVLFAFMGLVSIPEVEEIIPGKQKQIKRAIIWGGTIPIILYALFTLAVLGVTGENTTQIATVGLGEHLGPGVMIFGNLFALFAMMTSFFALGFGLRRTYEWDFNVPKIPALFLAIGLPLVVFMIGITDFITTIGVAGALFGSIQALIIIAMFWRSREKGDVSARAYALHYASFIVAVLLVVFLIGGVYGVLDIVNF